VRGFGNGVGWAAIVILPSRQRLTVVSLEGAANAPYCQM
jgi:hypothetical protein